MTDQQRAELDELSARLKLVKAEDVVEHATSPESALHELFEWDDTEAARKHRIQQARGVLRVYVRYEPRVQRTTRALVSVPSDRTATGGYRPVGEVLQRPDWQASLVAEVEAKIRGLRQHYAYLRQLDGLWPRLDAAVADYLAELRRESPVA